MKGTLVSITTDEVGCMIRVSGTIRGYQKCPGRDADELTIVVVGGSKCVG